jgi:hypothetical protein
MKTFYDEIAWTNFARKGEFSAIIASESFCKTLHSTELKRIVRRCLHIALHKRGDNGIGWTIYDGRNELSWQITPRGRAVSVGMGMN